MANEYRLEWTDVCDVKHSETRNTHDHGPRDRIIAKWHGMIGPCIPVRINGIRGEFHTTESGVAYFEATTGGDKQ